jgi:tetratricopeptide (TPR) repeat protein
LLEEFPNQVSFSIEISRLRTRQEDPDGARSTLVSALETKPNDPTLLWAQASYLEEDGDINSAIDIYEALYERDTTSIIVANNLASLLATYRTNQASLERAWQIARRFRDTEIPALQDTYGWITHRRGESEEAIVYLEPAAEGLSLDPIVQFHFAEALFAVGRKEDALVQYRLVLDLAGATDTRPQIGIARARIQEIEVQ